MAVQAAAAVSVNDAVAYVAKQAARTNSLHANRTQYPDRVMDPTAPANGIAQWKLAHAPGSWTSGFWPGVNWHLAALTGDETWATTAEAYNVGLAPNQYNNRTHDVGFMMMASIFMILRNIVTFAHNLGIMAGSGWHHCAILLA